MDLLPGVKSVLAEMDPLIPIARNRTLSDVRDESMAREQFVLMLLAFSASSLSCSRLWASTV